MLLKLRVAWKIGFILSIDRIFALFIIIYVKNRQKWNA